MHLFNLFKSPTFQSFPMFSDFITNHFLYHRITAFTTGGSSTRSRCQGGIQSSNLGKTMGQLGGKIGRWYWLIAIILGSLISQSHLWRRVFCRFFSSLPTVVGRRCRHVSRHWWSTFAMKRGASTQLCCSLRCQMHELQWDTWMLCSNAVWSPAF